MIDKDFAVKAAKIVRAIAKIIADEIYTVSSVPTREACTFVYFHLAITTCYTGNLHRSYNLHRVFQTSFTCQKYQLHKLGPDESVKLKILGWTRLGLYSSKKLMCGGRM